MSYQSVQKKKKYFQKVLSLSAVDVNIQRTYDTEDLFGYDATLYGQLFMNFNVSMIMDFVIHPYELEPFNIDFEVELPDVEEWLQGIKIKFRKVDMGKQWQMFNKEVYGIDVPPVFDYDTFIRECVRPEYQPQALMQKYKKLIVGESFFGMAFVDPVLVREFIRSTSFRLFLNRMDYERYKKIIDDIVQKTGIDRSVAEGIFNRIMSQMNIAFQNLVLGFNILGVSRLSPRASPEAKVRVPTYRRITYDVKYHKLSEPQIGFILGLTPLGQGLLLPKGFYYRIPFHHSPAYWTPKFLHFVYWKIQRLKSRYRCTAIAFANYQRIEEMMDFYKNERADQWFSLYNYREHIENLVDNYLNSKKVSVDTFKRNLYKRAVLMLVGYKKKHHKWGYKMFEYMDDETFKEWWVSYWVRQGLDEDILRDLYQRFERVIKITREQTREIGKRLRKIRYRLASYMK